MYSDKFKNLVLYVLQNSNYKDEGIKKLNKILYFIDFYFYRDNERFISDNIKYVRARMGPIIDNYKEIFNQLERDGILGRDDSAGPTHYCPKIKANISKFTSEEIDHINKTLEKYGQLSSAELESISHEQQPWILTENNGDIIDPDLVLLVDDGESEEEIEIKNERIKRELVELANNECEGYV